MNLREYLQENNIDKEKFAAELMITYSYFKTIYNCWQKPSKRIAQQIELLTHGKVQAEDILHAVNLRSMCPHCKQYIKRKAK